MKRFKHNLSYYHLTTCDMGQLVPVGLTEALPGDTIQHHTNILIRVSPLAAPIMHNVTARLHHFFVPHRLVWDSFEDFITGGEDGMNADTVPTRSITSVAWNQNRLFDHLGIPNPGQGNELNVSSLPISCYNLIYNEYYRDQDLVPKAALDNAQIKQIAWEKDYFTTCRPWSAKGPEVTLPVGERAPVLGIGTQGSSSWVDEGVVQADGSSVVFDNSFDASISGRVHLDAIVDGSSESGADYPNVYADLSQATAIPVNDFRKALALQRYQEARARYGSRYTEYLRFLGVRPKDERLQRPEFLGGGQAPIQFSEILQTAPETGQVPSTEYGVGDLYGHGIAAMRSNKYRRTIEEHGYVMSLLSVRPKAIYANALDRTWLRRDKEDFFQKELQHIGQQEIYNNEVYVGDGDNTEVFGYQDRYADYRQNFSKVSGEFRNILNYWHMAREFESQPVLNQSFTDCVPTKRIHNEQTQNALWVMCQHRMAARRMVDRSAMPRIY